MQVHAFIDSFIINNQENFQKNYLYTTLIKEISTIFVNQMPNYFVFKESIPYDGIKHFGSLPPNKTVPMNDKAKLEAAFRKYLNTHCFYCADEFFMYEDDL
jgi:hypothetical protein